MHQFEYNDGNLLSAVDQLFILDNVFTHHPNRLAKMGVGIDYVMVNKHTNFPNSKCLFVNTTDGHKQDFLFHKCLDNFIKGKYPDLVEAFIEKYFRQS
ncbi:hypothetical protein REPUB_Repub14bG0089400 [Reevesia pubescens]